MLDLDSIAEKLARARGEQETNWRDAVWSPGFQAIAKNMTDGEVETLLASCPSLSHFRAVLAFFDDSLKREKPYKHLMGAATALGMNLREWIARLPL